GERKRVARHRNTGQASVQEAPSRRSSGHAEDGFVIAIVLAVRETPFTEWPRSCNTAHGPGFTRGLIGIIERLSFEEGKPGLPTYHTCLTGEWAVHRRRDGCVIAAGLGENDIIVVGNDVHIDVVAIRTEGADKVAYCLRTRFVGNPTRVASRGSVRVADYFRT